MGGTYHGITQKTTFESLLSRSKATCFPDIPTARVPSGGTARCSALDFHEYFDTVFECRLVNSGDVSIPDYYYYYCYYYYCCCCCYYYCCCCCYYYYYYHYCC